MASAAKGVGPEAMARCLVGTSWSARAKAPLSAEGAGPQSEPREAVHHQSAPTSAAPAAPANPSTAPDTWQPADDGTHCAAKPTACGPAATTATLRTAS